MTSKSSLQGVTLFAILAAAAATSFLLRTPAPGWEWFPLAGMGAIGLVRWSWLLWHATRAQRYLAWDFPRLRAAAQQVSTDDYPEIAFVVPSYKEDPEICGLVARAIGREVTSLGRAVTVVVSTASVEEGERFATALSETDQGRLVRLIRLLQRHGKRHAMADALRELAAMGLGDDAVVALMDGDTEVVPGTLRGTLPLFRAIPDLGALTTDEEAQVRGPTLFTEWFRLRFAQRHQQMASLSRSHRLLCLTGRFSLFRARYALAPGFAKILEADELDDWLWGRFKLLSGDDKSTWFYLLRERASMLYVPDVSVISHETLTGSQWKRALDNMRRWYGNMLRTNRRAIRLGPQVVGPFAWLCLVDQRVSMWTSLVTPTLGTVYVVMGEWHHVAAIAAWVVASRSAMLLWAFRHRQTPVSALHLPLLIATQWVGSVIKIWTQMHLSRQSWANRGIASAQDAAWTSKLQAATARFLLVAQAAVALVAALAAAEVVAPVRDLRLIAQAAPAAPGIVEIVRARGRHVWSGACGENTPRAWGAVKGVLGIEQNLTIPLPGVCRVRFPAGSASPAVHRAGSLLGGIVSRVDIGLHGADALTLAYRVRFPEGFDFARGGKLPGLYGGEGSSGGAVPDGTDGFSARLMWREGGTGEVYAYLPTSEGYGTSIAPGRFTFEPGRWHDVEMTIVLNDPTMPDGQARLTVDGEPVIDERGLLFRTTPSLTIDGLFFSSFFGGSDETWATPVDSFVDLASFEAWQPELRRR